MHCRKQDFHHLKRLQREEIKETTEFYNRIRVEREAQDKKVDLERQEVERRFEGVSDVMTRKQKKEIEKLEQLQIQQFRSRSKTLKAEQVRCVVLTRPFHFTFFLFELVQGSKAL